MSRFTSPEQTLERLKKEAKRWLKALRAGDTEARRRFAEALADPPAVPTLRDVQHALARELGFPGWAALKESFAELPAPGSHASLINRFLDSACPDHHVRGLQDHLRARHTAMRLLSRHPEMAHASFHTAVVCGDVASVTRALADNPALATTRSPGLSPYRAMAGRSGDLFHELGPKGWEPLLYLCFTRLALDAANDNAVEIARLLLVHGADTNAYFMAGSSRYTPLVGVIGEGEEERPPHPRRDELVRLLLDAGAEPYDQQVMYNLGFRADYLWYLELIHARSLQLGRAADWADPEWRMLDMGAYGTGARWLLEHAIMRGDAELAEWCLQHGANPNAAAPQSARSSQRTLYQTAGLRGHPEIAELLARYGAQRTESPIALEDVLLAVCSSGDVDAVRFVLTREPDLLRSPRAARALLAAARKDRVEVVGLLLDLGMSPDTEGDARERPLHAAAAANAVGVAQLLVARGAEIDPREENFGNTPLGNATYHQHHDMIELLAPLSRDIRELTYLGRVERVRALLNEDPRRARVVWNRQTPLMLLPPHDEHAALELVKEFLRHGADATVVNRDGATAADRAEAMGMFEVAAYLRHVPVNPEAELRRIVEARDAAALRALLRDNAAARELVNAPLFPFGGTALPHAADDAAVVDVLLEFGADPNRRSDWWAGGFHPLHTLTGDAAERLIAAGAVIDACAAANLDRIDLLRSILEQDPQRVHERGGDGQTPLHFARSHSVADLLLEHGADIDSRDVDHRATPAQWMLDRARGAGRYDLAQHLVARGASTDIFLGAALGLADTLRNMLEADASLLELRTGQGEYGEKPPSSYHIYFWTIGPNLSPLQVAEQFEQDDAVAVLRSFASPKQQFIAACSAARADEARSLLGDHPALMHELGTDDQRALADAAWAPNSAAVELMMELGFDPAVPGPNGGNALHCAAWEGSPECVQAILSHARGRALIHVRDATHGGTPLGWCWHGSQSCGRPDADHVAVARLLVDAGARPDPEWEEVPDWLLPRGT